MFHGHFHLVIIFIHQVKHHLLIHIKIVNNNNIYTRKNLYNYFLDFTSASDLETIARRHGFEPLYSTNEKQSQTKFSNFNSNSQWMNAGVLFTDKTIEPDFTRIHKTGLQIFLNN